MRIGDVIGTVTLNRAHTSILGARFKLVTTLSWDNLAGSWDDTLYLGRDPALAMADRISITSRYVPFRR